ncbi:ribokinase [Schaalia sp. 19OD2882]|uniref:ribokinase n=1 Tax=Schaalia sp. 19OD2882 TaxID=2794089 RepID=UPI001C1EADCD|nr:ribokinase [Schaalia sp. 19OD2882]QWW19643.1 ribokinase [Schaalia sp. 19OD2882]
MDIAVIGSNNVDLITYVTRMPVDGETIEAPDFSIGCGGKGSNQAVAAARLGAEVLMVTCVGDDAFASMTLENYRANGIGIDLVKQVPGTSGVAPIFVDPDSHNRIIIVKGANNGLAPEDLEAAADRIAQCRLIVVQLEIRMETVLAAIDLGNRLGVPVLLNPAPASPDLDLEWAARCDYVMPNETELALLTGMPVEDEAQVREAAMVLLRRGCRHVVVTLGSRGVLWLHGDEDGALLEEALVPSVQVEAVDTTGAGDAFIGCFARCLTRGDAVPQALATANAYAALSVTGRGTQTSYPDADTFDQWCSARGLARGCGRTA